MGVPDVEGAQVDLLGRAGPAPDLSSALRCLQHPVVVGADAGEARRARDQQVVEEPAPLGRVALDQRQVLGGEQHGAQDAEDLPGPRHRRPVDPGPVRPAGGDLDLDEQRPVVAHHLAADHGALRAEAHQRRVLRDPVRPEGGEVADRLDQVGLALPVGADERRHARVQRELDLGVGAEVGQREMGRACI